MADTGIDTGSDAFGPPVVHLRFDSTPETLTLVRGVLGAMAELLALDAELLDDMKTAISEACNNVVLHAYDQEAGPLEVLMCVSRAHLVAVIRDEGAGIPEAADPEDGVHGVGLPLIKALTDHVDFNQRPGGGTEVRMEFAGTRGDAILFALPDDIGAEDGWVAQLQGDVVASLSPVHFLGPVLGRLARALAARARFSLDRFSDVYLVTDAIAAHVTRSASRARVGFAIATDARRLEISLGPLMDGSGAELQAGSQVREPAAALMALSDAVEIRPLDGGELLEVVLTDGPGRLAGGASRPG